MDGDIKTRNEVILSMYRFIGKQAAKWKSEADINDLIQVGVLAILEHWHLYRPDKCKPITYFSRIVACKIMEYAAQRLVRVPTTTLANMRHGKGKPATIERIKMAIGEYKNVDDVEI